jgi:hypothetical protein
VAFSALRRERERGTWDDQRVGTSHTFVLITHQGMSSTREKQCETAMSVVLTRYLRTTCLLQKVNHKLIKSDTDWVSGKESDGERERERDAVCQRQK